MNVVNDNWLFVRYLNNEVKQISVRQAFIDADKIIVLDEGKIDAIGTHEELLKTNKIYQEVYSSQMKGDE